MWFEHCLVFLAEFDFAGIGDDGDLTFTEEQKRQIQKVNKTEISVNASKTRAGGRPAVSFHNPHLPLTSRSVAKLSLTCMGIFGSSAAGKCVPPHFQLPTSATAEEREKIRYEFLTHTLDTHGRFSCTEERSWPCMIGMNKKGGMMDKEEFKKYIDNSIVPLYHDLEDTPGKRILLKVDSGPGCNGRELLMKCQFCGLYIYPGLPNATSVQQEMDLNYGPFKSIVCNNLKEISSASYAAELPKPLNMSMFGLIVYGHTIPVGMSTITCQNALAKTFDEASNKNSCREVGAVPHTRKL